MIDRVKIAQDPQRSRRGTQYQKRQRSLFGRKQPCSRRSIASANNSATRFRKKLFWINGRSPESRTKAFIHAKQNADKMMQIMPFCRSDKERFVMIFIFFH